jgi:hypothetical protein
MGRRIDLLEEEMTMGKEHHMDSSENGATALLREQLRAAWETLEGTTGDLSPETAQWIPPGTALPIGAAYAHVVLALDGVVNGMVRCVPPLFAAGFAGKTGTSELHPGSGEAGDAPFDPEDWGRVFAEWCRRLKVDLQMLHEYAAAVFDATDAWLATLSDADLKRNVDLTPIGIGPSTISFILSNVVIGHIYCHTGEIAALKGTRGLKGYPF